MMGKQERTESLFYYFRLEDQIPPDLEWTPNLRQPVKP